MTTPARRSLDPEWYHSAELLEREERALFGTGWVGVGRRDRFVPGTVVPGNPGHFAQRVLPELSLEVSAKVGSAVGEQ